MNMNYYQISAEELGKNAKVPLLKLGDSGEVFYEIALEMVNEIEKNNAVGRRTVFICPVGPVGQYPIFVRLVNERRLSLKNCWFINMDEYLTDDGEWIDESSALSFHGFMNRTVYSRIDPELVMPENQRIFPDPHDPDHIAKVIDELGGVDIEIDQNEYLAIRSILLGKDPNMPDGPGLVHMTGRIALAYMRTRSTGSGGDFARTERQRKVVSQLFDKCRDLSLMELVGLYNSVSSGMKMSLSAMDILSVLSQGYALMTSGADFVEYRIPQDGTYSYGQVGSSSVLDVRWKTNRTRFHALLDNEP